MYANVPSERATTRFSTKAEVRVENGDRNASKFVPAVWETAYAQSNPLRPTSCPLHMIRTSSDDAARSMPEALMKSGGIGTATSAWNVTARAVCGTRRIRATRSTANGTTVWNRFPPRGTMGTDGGRTFELRGHPAPSSTEPLGGGQARKVPRPSIKVPLDAPDCVLERAFPSAPSCITERTELPLRLLSFRQGGGIDRERDLHNPLCRLGGVVELACEPRQGIDTTAKLLD